MSCRLRRHHVPRAKSPPPYIITRRAEADGCAAFAAPPPRWLAASPYLLCFCILDSLLLTSFSYSLSLARHPHLQKPPQYLLERITQAHIAKYQPKTLQINPTPSPPDPQHVEQIRPQRPPAYPPQAHYDAGPYPPQQQFSSPPPQGYYQPPPGGEAQNYYGGPPPAAARLRPAAAHVLPARAPTAGLR
ncbi:hypothetical protein H2199_000802 [Coniosporium tulheliwenetii]|uniref:Uncharacterized protein n=1 Tax=Coniosporium tulheliwenetii TaxID=3383036 RepID=A0ACC2ZMU0_9PEZI|nr:hypothetical protein H2199_000802 [Cladosporium sp. JES 115]